MRYALTRLTAIWRQERRAQGKVVCGRCRQGRCEREHALVRLVRSRSTGSAVERAGLEARAAVRELFGMAQGTVKWFNPDKGYGFIAGFLPVRFGLVPASAGTRPMRFPRVSRRFVSVGNRPWPLRSRALRSFP